ncbi:hypothetical protein N7488_004809 [Penicillium malachiteum]|nr:hypothetical protein N7488_004809 [Penicillium malachiteum]
MTSAENKHDARSYHDALHVVLDDCILLMNAPRKMMTLPFAPKSWHELAKAANNFKQHMVYMLDGEIEALNSGSAGSSGLMTSEKASTLSSECGSNAPSKGLSVDKIFGNIFVINFAGHNTTANTLSFAMLLLAANPDVQDWFETLRHFPPIPSLPKSTSEQPQLLKVGEKGVIIPANVVILGIAGQDARSVASTDLAFIWA